MNKEEFIVNEYTIALLTLVFTIIGVIVTALIAMFPTLFPKIGAFLKSKPHLVIIFLLICIVISQQIFILVKLTGGVN